MSRWGTIFLLVVALGAGAFLFFFEPNMKALRRSEAGRTDLIRFDPLQVEGLRITSGSEVVELTKEAGGWMLGPELPDQADARRVAEILLAAADLQIVDKIPASEIRSEKDLRRFNLEDPRNKLEILGGRPKTIHFGREAVGDDLVYVRINDDWTVYVVSDSLRETAFQNRQTFRDPRLTRYEAGAIDRLIIRRPDGEIEMERRPTGWHLVRPLQVVADSEKVNGVLNALLGAQILEFAGAVDGAGEGSPTGATEVLFFPDNTDSPEKLVISSRTDSDGQAFSRVDYAGRNSVFYLEPAYGQVAAVTPDQLRDRRLLRLNLDTVDLIRVEAPDKTPVTWKREGDDWRQEGSGRAAVAQDVNKIIGILSSAAVERFQVATPDVLRDAGLLDNQTLVRFDSWTSENTPEARAGRHPVTQLRLGRIDSGKAMVRVNDDPEVCQVSAGVIEQFLDWATAMSADTPPPPPPTTPETKS